MVRPPGFHGSSAVHLVCCTLCQSRMMWVLAAHGLWAAAYPGPAYLRPAIHYAPTCLQQGG